jgi:cytochrome c5
MKRSATIIATAIALTACAHGSKDYAETVYDGDRIDREAAYQEFCAACHDTGMLGAPRIGEPMDWEVRSSLWQAVLMEHAKQGYYDMPARGGRSDVPDEVINAAAQYMLEKTYPDRPRD